MKIPFDIKYRPQIESGEYKVETNDHHSVRIICWNKNTGGFDRIVALVAGDSGKEKTLHYTEEGLCVASGGNKNKDLFIVTPEPELTEFEKCLLDYAKARDEYEFDSMKVVELNQKVIELTKSYSKTLIAIAKKELCKEWNKNMKDEYARGKRDGLTIGYNEAMKEFKELPALTWPPKPISTHWPPCLYGGECTNPSHDCSNCPRGSVTTAKVEDKE